MLRGLRRAILRDHSPTPAAHLARQESFSLVRGYFFASLPAM
jgi:hypothetical protein